MSDEKQELTPHEWFGLTPQGVSDAVSDYILAKHFPEDDEIDAVVQFDRRHGATICVTHRRRFVTVTDEERAERAWLASEDWLSTPMHHDGFIAGYLAALKETK